MWYHADVSLCGTANAERVESSIHSRMARALQGCKAAWLLVVLCTIGRAHANSFATGFHMFKLPCIDGLCFHQPPWHTYSKCSPAVVSAEVNGVTAVRTRTHCIVMHPALSGSCNPRWR